MQAIEGISVKKDDYLVDILNSYKGDIERDEDQMELVAHTSIIVDHILLFKKLQWNIRNKFTN